MNNEAPMMAQLTAIKGRNIPNWLYKAGAYGKFIKHICPFYIHRQHDFRILPGYVFLSCRVVAVAPVIAYLRDNLYAEQGSGAQQFAEESHDNKYQAVAQSASDTPGRNSGTGSRNHNPSFPGPIPGETDFR